MPQNLSAEFNYFVLFNLNLFKFYKESSMLKDIPVLVSAINGKSDYLVACDIKNYSIILYIRKIL